MLVPALVTLTLSSEDWLFLGLEARDELRGALEDVEAVVEMDVVLRLARSDLEDEAEAGLSSDSEALRKISRSEPSADDVSKAGVERNVGKRIILTIEPQAWGWLFISGVVGEGLIWIKVSCMGGNQVRNQDQEPIYCKSGLMS